MATVQEDIKALQKQLDEATDYDERTVLRRKIRELKKASGQAVGSVRRGDAGYRRPGTGLKGPSLKPISASTVHHGGSYLPSSTSAAKVSSPKRALSPAVDSAKQEAVSPSSSLPSSRKSSQSVESKDSLARAQAEGSRDQTASPVGSGNEPLDVNDRPRYDRDTPVDRDLDVEQVQPDVEEADLGEEVVQKEEEERHEEQERAVSPIEQVEAEDTYEPEDKQDEPEDKQDEEPEDKEEEPEDTPEVTQVEPEDEPVEEEEIAYEPSAVQEHEPEMQEEECPVADDEVEIHREPEPEPEPEPERKEPEPQRSEAEPEKKELTTRRRMQPQGEVRKDKKGPEQVDFRNVLRKTEKPASLVASTKFYKSGASETKQDSDEPQRTESPVDKPSPQPFQVNGAEDVDSVVEAYEARREARRKAREARRQSTDDKKGHEITEKLTYREKREQELKKQASQSGTPQQQQSAPPRPMQRQTSSNPTKQLLQWAQHKTRFYDDVNVTDFTHSFKDGLALAAIMHCYMPECVPMDELSVTTPRRNFEVAFAAAKEAGIPEMLDADDFLSVTVPDAQSVMTYLVTVYQHFN